MAKQLHLSDLRSEIAQVYTPAFAAGLKPRQVVAVYNNMKKRGKFEECDNTYYQYSIFDYLNSKGELKNV